MNDIQLIKLRAVTPAWLKRLIKKTPFGRSLAQRLKKYSMEMNFQRNWAKKFAANKDKVAEYWDKYRYMPEIKMHVEFGSDKKLLDVGCGISSVLHFVDGQKHALDPNMVEYKKIYQYPADFKLVHSGVEHIPFEDNYFDVVFSSNVLDHVSSPADGISEIQRVLKPGGHFVFTIEVYPDERKRDDAHPHTFTLESVHRLVSGRFEILFEATSPWVSLSRYVDGKTSHEFDEAVYVLKNLKQDLEG